MNKTYRAGVTTLALIYFLILVGGIVRSTGAGMGCPDWPKCFDSYIPPTSVNSLPSNYADLLLEKRIEKNKRLERFIALFSDEKTVDHNYDEKIEFNFTKAWIEYLNRIVGVVIGLAVLVFAFFTVKYYWTYNRTVSFLGLASLLLTIVQGWIGSVVVSTNLLPGLITVHMVIALLICFFIIYVLYLIRKSKWLSASSFQYLPPYFLLILFLTILSSFIQLNLGTSVRESVDIISSTTNIKRSNWLDEIGLNFYIHRSLSLFILIINAFVFIQLKKVKAAIPFQLQYWLISIIAIEIITGVVFYYFGFPASLQPIHLLLANIMIGIQFFLFVFSYGFKKLNLNKGD